MNDLYVPEIINSSTEILKQLQLQFYKKCNYDMTSFFYFMVFKENVCKQYKTIVLYHVNSLINDLCTHE